MRILTILFLSTLILSACTQRQPLPEKRLLVFSKTDGYRHASIEAGQQAFFKLGESHAIRIDTTENADFFVEDSLIQYSAVVFLNTTLNVLNAAQQAAFMRYIQAGGGYVGIHAAADTEYHWPWYGKLAGAWFKSHPSDPNIHTGMMQVVDQTHGSTKMLDKTWERTDEFYNFKSINPDIHPLITIDESTYEGGENGDFHPMAWYHEFDGGRSFYTNFGHTKETFSEPLFLEHLMGGIEYAIGKNLKPDYSLAHTLPYPDERRFGIEVLAENLDEPLQMKVMENGSVIFVERKGAIKIYDPAKKQVREIANMEVHTVSEDGLLGVGLDPDFPQNNWIYLYYSVKGDKPVNRLSRVIMKDEQIDFESEITMLEVEVQREQCCHTGGGIQFGSDGLMYLSTGDNTNPFDTKYGPIDGREGRNPWDGRKSSANTQDLRGKILRIQPTEAGSYTIPDGNLFAKDGSEGRPEIYVMGCRNPYRISVDPKKHYVYWGDVGPDGVVDSTHGPRGYDEFNQAKAPGFFGWPLLIGDNKPYRARDFETNELGDWFDAEKPLNNSPNNTGAQILPPAQKAMIWYPYGDSKEFPIVGKGSRNAMAGPVYYEDLFANSTNRFPTYYDGKLLIYDFMRDWIFACTFDENDELATIERFLPDLRLSSPMDMIFGPDGALYILEYGNKWFAKNADSRLLRIEYTPGNFKPVAQIKADKTIGAAPLTVAFSATDSYDFDEDPNLKYTWTFADGTTLSGEAVEYTFAEPGAYQAQLSVTDSEGASSESMIDIQVGNEPPKIDLSFAGNRSFYWDNASIPYAVSVRDLEDEAGDTGGIDPEAVKISFNYLDGGFDKTMAAQDHAALSAAGKFAAGKALFEGSDCQSCHAITKKVVGPALREVALRYQAEEGAGEYIAGKIINGSSGVWGAGAMAAHPQFSQEEAEKIAGYVLSLADAPVDPVSLPTKGTLSPKDHLRSGEKGTYYFTISYTDKGGEKMGPLTAYENIILSSNRIEGESLDLAGSSDVRLQGSPGKGKLSANLLDNSYLRYNAVDFSYIGSIRLRYSSLATNGQMEIRANALDGPLLAVAKLPNTGGGSRFETLNVDLTTPVEGFNSFYLIFEAKDEERSGNERTFRVDWLEFER